MLMFVDDRLLPLLGMQDPEACSHGNHYLYTLALCKPCRKFIHSWPYLHVQWQMCPFSFDLVTHRHGHQMPLYINLIRDPFERILSRHYYILYESKRTPQEVKEDFNLVREVFETLRPGNNVLNMNFVLFLSKLQCLMITPMLDTQYFSFGLIILQTFSECVQQNKRICMSPSNLIELVRYFCGQDPVCESKGGSVHTVRSARLLVIQWMGTWLKPLVTFPDPTTLPFSAEPKRMYRSISLWLGWLRMQRTSSFFWRNECHPFLKEPWKLIEKQVSVNHECRCLSRLMMPLWKNPICFVAVSKLKVKYRNSQKIMPDDKTKNYVISKMSEAYDFYNFVKQRQYNMLQVLEKSSKVSWLPWCLDSCWCYGGISSCVVLLINCLYF